MQDSRLSFGENLLLENLNDLKMDVRGVHTDVSLIRERLVKVEAQQMVTQGKVDAITTTVVTRTSRATKTSWLVSVAALIGVAAKALTGQATK